MVFRVSLNGIDAFAADFWNVAGDAKVYAFHGAMGAGKTTIIHGLCRYKNVKDVVSSPTFSIINDYRFKENGIEKKIFHMDLYRLNTIQEIIEAGVEDCLYSGEICFVEWAEKAIDLFSNDTVHVFVETAATNERLITIGELKASNDTYQITS
jgi:tRNA threonylcarbamoyladenosine biosynthesis protein TsaE